MLSNSELLIALLLTTFAGLSTGIGALFAFFSKGKNTRMISGALGLSAGVMIYISFMEILPEAMDSLRLVASPHHAEWYTLLAFFGGVGLIAIIDFLIPEDENPHEAHQMEELSQPNNHHLKRMGVMLALAIGIHNFPEGIASFISALDGLDVALPIIIAIAIHNIPEGIAISVPIYQSTGNKRKALRFALLAGLAEPIGAAIGMAFLLPFWTPALRAICMAVVAGIMIYISFDELLPGSEAYGHHHVALACVILGMALMAVSLTII